MHTNNYVRFLFLLGVVCTGTTGAVNLASASPTAVFWSPKGPQNDMLGNPATPVRTAAAALGAPRGTANEKHVVCHKGRAISVGASAVAAHLAHGDSEGACGDTAPSAPAPARYLLAQ